MRLIDADALGIGKAKREVFNNPEYADGWNSAIDLINNAPTVDVVERKVGEWKERKTFYAGVKNPIEEWQSARCSICGKYHTTPYLYYFDDFAYCPNCGAEMEVEE